MRFEEKTTIPLPPTQAQPSRIIRRYDSAKTPFHRLCETDAIPEQTRRQLQALSDHTNPRQLRREIYQLLDEIFLLPGAIPGHTEDVYETLFTPRQNEKGGGILVTLSFERTTGFGNILI